MLATFYGSLLKYHKLHLPAVRLRLAANPRETRARLCCRSLHLQQRRSRSVNLWEFCFAACRVRPLQSPLLLRPSFDAKMLQVKRRIFARNAIGLLPSRALAIAEFRTQPGV